MLYICVRCECIEMMRYRLGISLIVTVVVVVVDHALLASALDQARYSPFSTLFDNPYDYADSESYATQLFTSLYQHMNTVKRDAATRSCANIPVPKTVLADKYFNPAYELMQHKPWMPPKEHQHVVYWSQLESYRSSLLLSYLLQDDNAKFPPGILFALCNIIFP